MTRAVVALALLGLMALATSAQVSAQQQLVHCLHFSILKRMRCGWFPRAESDASLPCAFTLISSNNTLYSRCFHNRSEIFPGGEGKLLRPAAGVFAQCKQHMPTNCQWWLHPADAAAWLLELHAPRICMIAVQTLRVRLLVAC